MAQQIKDMVLSLLWLWLLLWYGFHPWPRNFCMPQAQPKKKRYVSGIKKPKFISPLSLSQLFLSLLSTKYIYWIAIPLLGTLREIYQSYKNIQVEYSISKRSNPTFGLSNSREFICGHFLFLHFFSFLLILLVLL